MMKNGEKPLMKKLIAFAIRFVASIISSGALVYIFYLLYPFIYMYFEEVDRGVLSDDYFAAFEFLALSILLFFISLPSFFFLFGFLAKSIRSYK